MQYNSKKIGIILTILVINLLIFSSLVSAGWFQDLLNSEDSTANNNLISGNAVWEDAGDVIYTTGKVGIGTSSPGARLDIAGGEVQIRGTNSNSHFVFGVNENVYIRAGKTSQDVFIQDSHNGDTIIATGGGNVGIGTKSPGAKLHVLTPLRIDRDGVRQFDLEVGGGAGSFIITDITASAERLRIDSSGNVGIATSSPKYKLDVAGTINAQNVLINGQPISGGIGSSLWSNGNGNIYYTSGKVGIGTPSPAFKLDVKGTINAQGILINGQPISGGIGSSLWSTGSDNIYYTSGKVGIGTTNPKTKLHITGDLFIDGGRIISKLSDGTCQACGPDNSDNWVCNKIQCP